MKEIHSSFVNGYPTTETPSDVFVNWGKEFGIKIHPSGLVLPENRSINSYKVVGTFNDLSQKIEDQRRQSKHIVLLPGSYDGVHVGHLSFVVQAKEEYMRQWNDTYLDSPIGRSDMFVVAVLDGDQLTSEVKENTYLKVTGKKGPIEHIDQRVAAMAELPIDLVGVAQSPNELELPAPTELMHNNIQAPDSVLNAIRDFTAFKADFERQNLGFDKSWWSIELWQMYLLSSLNKSELNGVVFPTQITRVLSKDEHKYYNEVSAIMKLCGINVMELDDVFCVSTKQIVERIGVEELIRIKRGYE